MTEPARPPSYPALDLPLKTAIARVTHGISPAAVSAAWLDWWTHLSVSPGKQLALAESARDKALRFALYLQQAAAGRCKPCVAPAPADKRFEHAQWQAQPWHALSQAFLLWQQWWQQLVKGGLKSLPDLMSSPGMWQQHQHQQ